MDESGAVRKWLGWVITEDDQGASIAIAQGSKTLPTRQVAFDAEMTAIEEVLQWYQNSDSDIRHLVIHPQTRRKDGRNPLG
jgi:hypothetical protein